MNLIIIIFAGVLAYIITSLFSIADGLIAKAELRQQEKKRLSSELYRFQLRQLYYYCKAYYIECGYSPDKAKILAVNAVKDMDDNLIVEEKYKLIKGFRNDERRRHKGSC